MMTDEELRQARERKMEEAYRRMKLNEAYEQSLARRDEDEEWRKIMWKAGRI